MRIRSNRRRQLILALVITGAAVLSSCASEAQSTELTVHLDQAQAWEMTGAAVSAGIVCGAGDRAVVGVEDLDGSPLSPQEFEERLQIAQESGGETVTYQLLVEHTCSDGSGAFVLREFPADDASWEVAGGNGAYTNLSGHGECELERAPWEEGDPPEGMPMTLHCTGKLSND